MIITDNDLKAIFKETTKNLIEEIYREYGISHGISKESLIDYVNKYPINIKFILKDKIQPSRQEVKEEERCQARTWSDGYMNMIQYKKDKNANREIDATVYGGLCKQKTIPNSLYCATHDQELVHGNYYMSPTPLVRGFFHKVNSHRL